MTNKPTKCRACDGRGYFYCDCHPADCICGIGEETCDECGGEGFIDPTYDDFAQEFDSPSPASRAPGSTPTEAPPAEQSQAAEIARLREALELIAKTNQIREFMGDEKSDGYGDQGWVVRDGQYAKVARAALASEGRE